MRSYRETLYCTRRIISIPAFVERKTVGLSVWKVQLFLEIKNDENIVFIVLFLFIQDYIDSGAVILSIDRAFFKTVFTALQSNSLACMSSLSSQRTRQAL